MDWKKLETFCRALPGATEDIKWGEHLVFSVGGKMFGTFIEDEGLPLGFKCSEDDFERLTKKDGIIPAPYAARFGWVSVRERRALGQAEAKQQIRASYEMVLAALPRRVREGIAPLVTMRVTGRGPVHSRRARKG